MGLSYPPDGEPQFGKAFKVTVGVCACLVGAMLLFAAWGTTERWLYLLPAFFFAVVGVVALPRVYAIVCGYVVAIGVFTWNIWLWYRVVTGKDDAVSAIKFSLLFGFPALTYILYRQLPGR